MTRRPGKVRGHCRRRQPTYLAALPRRPSQGHQAPAVPAGQSAAEVAFEAAVLSAASCRSRVRAADCTHGVNELGRDQAGARLATLSEHYCLPPQPHLGHQLGQVRARGAGTAPGRPSRNCPAMFTMPRRCSC
jgi:hypothetical protein